MKKIEKIKFWFGIILLVFALIGGIIFSIEGFYYNYSHILPTASPDGYSSKPVFFGLIAVAGAILLMSVKADEINDQKDIS